MYDVPEESLLKEFRSIKLALWILNLLIFAIGVFFVYIVWKIDMIGLVAHLMQI